MNVVLIEVICEDFSITAAVLSALALYSFIVIIQIVVKVSVSSNSSSVL